MSIPKRQHWVPRFYLRHFASPDSPRGTDRVWIFSRDRGSEPQLTNVDNIAAKKHLYTPKLEDGTRDPTVENKLADLEGVIASLWPRLANDFVNFESEATRKAIALFLSVQFLRHPERLDSITDFRLQVLDLLKVHPKYSNGKPIPQKLQIGHQVFPFGHEQYEEVVASGPESDERIWLDFIQDKAHEFAEILLAKRWSVVFIDDPLFVTSDYPLYVATPEHEKHQIGGKNAILMFPLSPTRILCFDDLDAPANRYFKLPNEAAGLYNMLTWVNTHRFMISPREIDFVLEGIMRTHDKFERETRDAS